MARQYFGTDGIRGKANQAPVTADVALRVGMAAGVLHRQNHDRSRVVIAKDTRLSGYMLEPALAAGFVSVGMDVILVGPMPTPAVAMLVRSLRADLGVMISASHNPYDDNGIKLFGPDGFKLTDETEHDIEALMQGDLDQYRASPDALGRAKRLDDAAGRYIEFAKATFPKGMRLEGMKIVLDCAHGAAYSVAPTVLWELEAEVIALGVKPNGFNINAECGSTHPQNMQATVIKEQADIGIALDGDADRLILCDEKGQIVDGDQLMAMVATILHKRGKLQGGGIVATQMSNMGLERYLQGLGLGLARTKVGDRYVVEHMREHGYNLGGEQSGHIILSDHATTGDGLIAALQVLALLKDMDKPASEVTQCFTPLPQKLKNIRYEGGEPLEAAEVQQAIAKAEAELEGKGRVFIRKSGTEPLIRIMAEAETDKQVDQAIDGIASAIEQVMKRAA